MTMTSFLQLLLLIPKRNRFKRLKWLHCDTLRILIGKNKNEKQKKIKNKQFMNVVKHVYFGIVYKIFFFLLFFFIIFFLQNQKWINVVYG